MHTRGSCDRGCRESSSSLRFLHRLPCPSTDRRYCVALSGVCLVYLDMRPLIFHASTSFTWKTGCELGIIFQNEVSALQKRFDDLSQESTTHCQLTRGINIIGPQPRANCSESPRANTKCMLDRSRLCSCSPTYRVKPLICVCFSADIKNLEARATREGWSDQRHAGATGQPGEIINSGLAQALKSCKTDCDVFKNGLEQWLKHLVTGHFSVPDKAHAWLDPERSFSKLPFSRDIDNKASGSQLLQYHYRRADFTSFTRNNLLHTETKQRSTRTASQPFTFSTALDKDVVKRYNS